MGLATAFAFARAGASVILAEIDETLGARAAARIVGEGGRACFVRCDVSREEDVAAAVEHAVATYGALDCAVNNAAIRPDHRPLVEVRLQEFDRVMAVDLRGVLLGLKYQLRQMQHQGRGAIVNITSINATRPRPLAVAYNAAKAAVIAVTRTAALEHADGAVRVNAVAPGAILTPMMTAAIERRGVDPAAHAAALSPMGRFGEPSEVAAASVWLCSDEASFVTGHVLAVDGGYLSS